MTSQMDSKVRFVRCPNCRQVLPEYGDVLIYECGGCGTILQAKNQKTDTGDTGSIVHEEDPTQKNGLDYLMSPSTDESDLEKILERCGNGISCRKEENGDLNQSRECHSSDVISCLENTESSPETSGHAGAEEDVPLVRYGTNCCNEVGDDDTELPGEASAPNNMLSSPKLNRHEDKSVVQEPGNLSPTREDENMHTSENISSNNSQNCMKELPTSTGFSGDLSSCYESCEDGDLSSLSGTDKELDENLRSHSISRSLAAVSFLLANPEDQMQKAKSSPIVSESFPLTEQRKQPQDETFLAFQRLSSTDTLNNAPQVAARTKLGVTLRSSTAKLYYDHGVNTSCEETENKTSIQNFRPSRRNFKDAESRSTNGLPKRDELPPRPINSSAALSAKKHYTTKGSKWSQYEPQEPTERSRTVSSKMTSEYWSRPPIYSRSSQVLRNGNFTSYEPKGLPARSVDPESKTRLLRMVYELQDQLKRVHSPEKMPHSRISSRAAKKEQSPAYNGERYPELRYAFNPRHLDQIRTSFQQGKAPRMAFSGDAIHFRHEVDCSCLRCYRQKWHYSAQLPRHAYYDEGNTVIYSRGPRDSGHSPHHSAPSSPYQYKSSEFSWSHDTMLDGIRQNNEVKKKQQSAKQHFRPIAGGAPIIGCYCCKEILQLPADFLLFKRKCHRLRCSACEVVLKFSLVKRIHIIEYNPEPRTPPPSEAGGHTETTNLASASGATDHQRGDPVSSCDGYGQSSHRSSTEMEHSFLAPPSETLSGIYLRQKMSADNPFETKKDGKKPMEQDSTNIYNSRKTFELGEPSSKVYKPENMISEIEEVPPEDGSLLHQLMGYSSPRRII
ncbi:hypothetical protein ACET3Z_009639 [Daucus carota]